MHATICDILSDLVQNSVEAGASRVELDVCTGTETISARVTDNGKGMDEATLAQAKEPFYSEAGKHDRRRVGLGIPFLYQTAEAVNGTADIRSAPGKGTTVRFTLDARHMDTPPFGDLAETVMGLMTLRDDYDLIVSHRTASDGYTFSKRELTAALGNLEEAGNLVLARRYIRSQEQSLTDAQPRDGRNGTS